MRGTVLALVFARCLAVACTSVSNRLNSVNADVKSEDYVISGVKTGHDVISSAKRGNGDIKRADDPTNDELMNLLQQQAAIIQNLQARLDALENTLHSVQAQVEEQGTSLRGRMDTQESKQLMEDRAVEILLQSVKSLGSRLDKQEQKVAFTASFKSVGDGHSYNVNISKMAPIVFNNLIHNTGNAYDVTTGRFTAPFPGVYAFTLHFMSSIGGVVQLGIAWSIGPQTGFVCHASAEGDSNDKHDQGSCTVLLRLSAGNSVYVTTDYHQDSQPVISSSYSYFSGVLIYSE